MGQLGTGVTKSRACKQIPHEIDLSDVPDEIDTELIAIASGYSHSLALTRCGRVLSWGFNGSGQLGHSEERVIWRPKVIEALMDSRVVEIACGLETSAVVTGAKSLFIIIFFRAASGMVMFSRSPSFPYYFVFFPIIFHVRYANLSSTDVSIFRFFE